MVLAVGFRDGDRGGPRDYGRFTLQVRVGWWLPVVVVVVVMVMVIRVDGRDVANSLAARCA